MIEQRHFERFHIPEDAIAVDAEGGRLGRVTVAGGGGMSIQLDPPLEQFHPGQRMQVTVIEPGLGVRHTIDVIVRYQNEESLGVEFVTGDPAPPDA